MTLRLFADLPLAEGATVELPPEAARHAQVRRVQPGDTLVLFDGRGGEWAAEVASIGRREVVVRVGAHAAVEREPALEVALAVGMPANERMDTLVEKATELGVAAIEPLHATRSVLRLDAGRAARRVEHWQAVAVAAAEQSGRTRVPPVRPVRPVADALSELPVAPPEGERRLLLSFATDARPLPALGPFAGALRVLSGPEGGLTADEEAAARRAGFVPVSLGPRVLRADTAPLAALAWLVLQR